MAQLTSSHSGAQICPLSRRNLRLSAMVIDIVSEQTPLLPVKESLYHKLIDNSTIIIDYTIPMIYNRKSKKDDKINTKMTNVVYESREG